MYISVLVSIDLCMYIHMYIYIFLTMGNADLVRLSGYSGLRFQGRGRFQGNVR